jgi:hypothetical protein
LIYRQERKTLYRCEVDFERVGQCRACRNGMFYDSDIPVVVCHCQPAKKNKNRARSKMNIRNISLIVFFLFSLSGSAPVWTVSWDLGIPELIGTRLTYQSDLGPYYGIQPGFLLTLIARPLGPSELWAFTPAIFIGNDIINSTRFSLSTELNISHPCGYNKYSKGGGFVVTPRVGFSFKKNHYFLRTMGGVSLKTFQTIGLSGWPNYVPSLFFESGFVIGKKSSFSSKAKNEKVIDSDYNSDLNDSGLIINKSDIYSGLTDRKHLITINPLSLLFNNSIGVNYSFALGKHTAIGISPELAFSDYSTKIGSTVDFDFYFRKVFYGWHIPIYSGIIPAHFKLNMLDLSASKTTTDLAYSFIIGAGIGYNWCFKKGFSINPFAGIAYFYPIEDPTQQFKDKLLTDAGLNYNEFKSKIIPITIGLGFSIGWSF